MNRGNLVHRSSTAERRVFSSVSSNGLSRDQKRSSSQIIVVRTQPFFCKLLYSKGKLVHSKLTIPRRVRPQLPKKSQPESTFSEGEILELQKFFHNKKALVLPSISEHKFPPIRNRLETSKAAFLRRVGNRLNGSTQPTSKYVSMASARSHMCLPVYDDLTEVFDNQFIEAKDEGYFTIDNDIDTDEEQQSRAVKNNLETIAMGFDGFVREVAELSRTRSANNQLRRTGRIVRRQS